VLSMRFVAYAKHNIFPSPVLERAGTPFKFLGYNQQYFHYKPMAHRLQ
jgi:hypothetical protein